jgi:hypothetical protein
MKNQRETHANPLGEKEGNTLVKQVYTVMSEGDFQTQSLAY